MDIVIQRCFLLNRRNCSGESIVLWTIINWFAFTLLRGRENFFCPLIEATLLVPDRFISVTLFVPMAYSYNCFPSIQFSQTGEILLLKHASLQIQKLQVHHDVKEIELYTNSFICSVDACGGNRVLSLVDSALLKINVWCRRQLDNYHAYFSKVSWRPLFATVCFSADGFFRYIID